MWFNLLRRLPRKRWLIAPLAYGAIPFQVAWDILNHGWTLLSGSYKGDKR